MIEFCLQADRVGVLTFDGKMTQEHTQGLKAALMGAVESCEHLMVCLEGLVEADVSCMEVFCSAYRTALKLNKRLTLANVSVSLRDFIRDNCSCPDIGCQCCNGTEQCFWSVRASNV